MEKYRSPPLRDESNSITTVILLGWLWFWVIHDCQYAINTIFKKINETLMIFEKKSFFESVLGSHLN